jgi:DNA-binding PadR family transcriptional regulator
MGQVRAFITKATNGVLTVDDKSLYRALRRYHSAELVDFTTEPGKGPDKKVYRLSPVGKEVLAQFITRNIKQTLLAPANRALIERNYHD